MKLSAFVLPALAGFVSLSPALAAPNLFRETFAADPAEGGWQVFGQTNLFHWNPTNQDLEVTWDSSQPTSYFYRPLGRTLTQADGFHLEFDLQLADATAAGWSSQLAIGLLRLADATSPDFNRSWGVCSNLLEFDYFPQTPQLKPSLDATVVDAANNFYFKFDDTRPLATNVTYHVALTHYAGARSITARISTGGQLYSTLPQRRDYGASWDFQLDALSITSYADDGLGDTVLAHGTVDNVLFVTPLPVEQVQALADAPPFGVRFASATNWVYTLERTVNFTDWTDAVSAPGTGGPLTLRDPAAPAAAAYYRVRADLP